MRAKLQRRFGAKPIVWVPAWGISKLRRRGGQYAGAVPGDALWFDAWCDRILSPAMADRWADLGVNLAVLPFSLGGSANAERAEREAFGRMAALLHARGIAALPYLQYQNILQETQTLPGAPWAVALDGSPRAYAYWRRTVCQSAPAFVSYLKGLIAEALDRGADGIWMDNTYLHPCRCTLCQAGFKRWLAAHRADLRADLSLDSFDAIEMPPAADRTGDPIVQALLEFNLQRNLEILRDLKAHLEALNPDAILASNPALDRGGSHAERGVDLRALLALHDLVYLENRWFPGAASGQLSGNAHGFIACAACGAAGIPGGWKHPEAGSPPLTAAASGLPESEADLRRGLFEAAAFGGATGMYWDVRARPAALCASPDDLLAVYGEHPAVDAVVRRALAFLRTLPVFGDPVNLANVAVLRHRESLLLDGDAAWAALHAAEDLLLAAGLPYAALFSEDLAARAAAYRLIVIPGAALLGDAERARIAAYVEAGGTILVLGAAGRFDERRRERAEWALKDLTGVSRFGGHGRAVVFAARGAGQCASLPLDGPSDCRMLNTAQGKRTFWLPAWAAERAAILAALDRLLGADRQVLLEDTACGPGDPGTVGASLLRADGGRIALHLFAYAPRPSSVPVRVRLHPALMRAPRPAWHTPDGEPAPVAPGRGADERLAFSLPNLRDYGVLIG